MPQQNDSKQKETPSMKAMRSIAPSIKSIGARMNQMKPEDMQKKKKKKLFGNDERSMFSPSKIYDDTRRGLSGLKYLPDYLLDNPRPKR